MPQGPIQIQAASELNQKIVIGSRETTLLKWLLPSEICSPIYPKVPT